MEKYIISERETFAYPVSLDRIWEIYNDTGYMRDYTKDTELDLYRQRNHIILPNMANYVALRTISGEGVLELGKEKIQAPQDSVIFFKINQKRKYYSVGAEWKFVWYEFKCDYTFFEINKPLIVKVTGEERTLLKKCVRHLKNSLQTRSASALFGYMLTLWIDEKVPSLEKYAPLMEKAVAYIQDNYSQKITVAGLAALCNISERLFREEFKRYTNKKPIVYINDFRLQCAKRLLLDSDLPLSLIAEKTGFTDQYVFSNKFKAIFGICPKNYRKKNQPKKSD